MIKQEVRTFQSRWPGSHTLMYPGRYLLTWIRVPWGWQLIAMEEYSG